MKFGKVRSIPCLCLVIAVLCFLLLPAPANAVIVDSGACGDNVTWELDDAGTLTISGTGAMRDYTWSTGPWYQDSRVKKVVVEDGVTSIGNYAFVECPALTAITFGKDVALINTDSVRNCSALTTISIPDGAMLKSSMFSGCDNLTYKEYENAKYLGNAENPYLVLMSVMDSNATTCTIHPDTKQIAASAFSRAALTTLTIPDKVEAIGQYAFMYCNNLTSVTIGSSVKNIHEDAFYNCNGVSAYNVAEDNGYYSSDAYGVLFDKEKTTILAVPGSLSGEYVIPDGVTYIGDYVFAKCRITSVSIPDSIEYVGYEVFGYNMTYNTYDNAKYLGNAENPYLVLVEQTSDSITSCEIHPATRVIGAQAFFRSSLTAVTIPDTVVSIGESGFYMCQKMETLTQSKNLTYIGDAAFMRCTALKRADIPAGVTYIGYNAFDACSSLEFISVAGENPAYCSDACGVLMDKAKTQLICVPAGISGDYVIADTVTKLEDKAFEKCVNLKSVTIPEGVTAITYGAFSECTALEAVIIPESVVSIASYAFAQCGELKQVIIPGDVTDIGSRAFYNCGKLELVALPAALKNVGGSAFEYCTGIQNVYYGGTEAQWNEIVIANYNVPLTSAPRKYNATIIGDQPGDINGDYIVNTDDVVQILLHISMPDLFPLDVPADFTGDGVVDTEDAIKLLLHISMPDLFPL